MRASSTSSRAGMRCRAGNGTGPAPAGAGPLPDRYPVAGLACRGSGDADAGGLRALRPLGYLELHVLVLLEGAEAVAVAVDLGVVHEDVRSVGAVDKAVALLRVEPLDGSLCHCAPYRGWIRVRTVRYPGRFSTRLSSDP